VRDSILFWRTKKEPSLIEDPQNMRDKMKFTAVSSNEPYYLKTYLSFYNMYFISIKEF
jgi:hypothetical protein